MNSIAIGNEAGNNNQSNNSIAIGSNAGFTGQQNNSIAIGCAAGYTQQQNYSIAIGFTAGLTSQQCNSISIGNQAGYTKQQNNSISIGSQAGTNNQNSYSVSIGNKAGFNNQQSNSIAIGSNAGQSNQGENSIAIGSQAGSISTSPNSIILNASGSDLSSNSSGLFMSPINSYSSDYIGETGLMIYNSLSKEIMYEPAKTFVINHPINPEKYLVHSCLEGPEAGVYYRGEGCIENDKYTTIILPDYVSSFATNLSVQITHIIENINDDIIILSATRIITNKFNVCGKNCKFWWTVYGKRGNINIEPNKNDVEVKGDGPYLWI